jgi:DNA modification methylase
MSILQSKGKTAVETQPPPAEIEIPDQSDFYKLPARFGALPLDEAPLGYEIETKRRETKVTKFEHAYPRIYLPFQEVKRESFGHGKKFEPTPLFPTGANRLFFGDNLHVMRQLPSKSIDLIYIDPPFFSGRNYNVIFGDKNEVRSFSDIWEGGMPGYLVWLNARLFEMKRLLKDSGSIYVHLDWHASHYVKVEMDKIFGADRFLNEVVWHYKSFHGNVKRYFARKHDILLIYTKSDHWTFNRQFNSENEDTIDFTRWNEYLVDGYKILGSNMPMQDTRFVRFYNRWVRENGRKPRPNDVVYEVVGQARDTVWDIKPVDPKSKDRIGYPTQKPEELLEAVIQAATNEGDVVADFFTGGGTTAAVAQRLNRRWIASDQSRIATAITADRITRVVEENATVLAAPDFTVEHWGVYESPRLEKLAANDFRKFVIEAYGGRPESTAANIHGLRTGVPLFVGEPSRKSQIGKEDVRKFAQAIFEEKRTEFGVMLGWNFDIEARRAAEILKARENKRIDFVRLTLVRLEDKEFREHITNKHKDYAELLSFIQPPEVRVEMTRIGAKKYRFDVSESVSLNPDGKLANVQWDFDFRQRFTSTLGYSFNRETAVEYEFDSTGKKQIACSVQDNQGGERTWIGELEVK